MICQKYQANLWRKNAIRLLLGLFALVGISSVSGADLDKTTNSPWLPSSRTNALVVTPALVKEYLTEARSHNPFLLAAQERVRILRDQAGAKVSTNSQQARLPSAMIAARMCGGLSGMCMSHPDSGSEMVEESLQNFEPWQRAMATPAQAQLALECQTRTLQRNLVKQLLKIALLEKEMEILERDVACLKMITGANKAYYGLGQLSQGQWLEAQNALALRNEKLTSARNNRQVEYVALNRLLGRELDSPGPELDLPEPAPPLPSTERFAESAVRSSPLLQAVDQEIAHPESKSAVSTSKIARLERAGCEALARETVLRLTVQIDAARREALLYRHEILPRAHQAVGGAQAACQVNQAGFCTLLQARRDMLEYELRYAQSIARQHELLADLCMVCTLDYGEMLAMPNAK